MSKTQEHKQKKDAQDIYKAYRRKIAQLEIAVRVFDSDEDNYDVIATNLRVVVVDNPRGQSRAC